MDKIRTQLNLYSIVAVPPMPKRFTIKEWHLTNDQRRRTCMNQQTLADHIIAECDRLGDEIDEKTVLNKREVDHNLAQKIDDIEFNKTEIGQQRKQVCLEIESLATYNERIMDAMESVREQALVICRRCIIFREGRIGIDLCHDNVERELLKEIEVIEGAKKLLQRTLEQGNEQIRRLKSTIYNMDRDLEDKGNVLAIELNNKSLQETSLSLSMYHGFTPLDVSTITMEEWEQFTRSNIERSAKEINSARQLRSYVDILLKQVVEDLIDQFHAVNAAFRSRIEQVREAKTKLEVQHHEIVRQVNELTRTITKLEVSIGGKEGFMALAHTRLGNRAQRPGVELCKDLVEVNLANEVYELRGNLTKLQHLLAEAQASRRYLLKTQIQLEEDINVKTNSLKIDEVDCMILRESINYQAY